MTVEKNNCSLTGRNQPEPSSEEITQHLPRLAGGLKKLERRNRKFVMERGVKAKNKQTKNILLLLNQNEDISGFIAQRLLLTQLCCD